MSVFRSISAVALVFFVACGYDGRLLESQGVVESQIVAVEKCETEEIGIADEVATVVALVLFIIFVMVALTILNELVKGGN